MVWWDHNGLMFSYVVIVANKVIQFIFRNIPYRTLAKCVGRQVSEYVCLQQYILQIKNYIFLNHPRSVVARLRAVV